MGFLSRAVAERKSADPLAAWAEILRAGVSSKAGPQVTLDSALKVATALACLRVISQGIAQVPWKLMRETEVAGFAQPVRKAAKDNQLYDLLHTQPNDWMTSFEFRETMVLHAALCGRAIAFKVRGLGGRIAELILLDPGKVSVTQNPDWSLTYKVTGQSGAVQDFGQRDIWHLRGPSWNGFDGMSTLRLAREALGLSMAAEDTHAKLHANGVRPSGIYSVEGTLGKDQHKDLKAWIEKEYAGAEKTGGVMVLDRAAKFVSNYLSGVDAQHIETRVFQAQEVCRFFGVMPIMVGISDKAATYASAEQMFLAHVVHTLSPWYSRIENSADVHLLTRADRQAGLYTSFVEEGLLRGALKDTAEYLSKLVDRGLMTRNEGRSKLELNPLEGLDEPLTPVNMQMGTGDVEPPDPDPALPKP